MINERSAACHGRSPVPLSPAAAQLCSLSKKMCLRSENAAEKWCVSLLSLFLGTARDGWKEGWMEGGREGNIPALCRAEVTAALRCLIPHLR